jgi:sigma-E factor negative regulatory protein RseC
MLEETGTVVRIEPNALWVETLTQSACGACHARSGCGQHTLGKVMATTSTVRALLQGVSSTEFSLHQKVRIGIPEDVVVKGALIAYLTPLLLMLLIAVLAEALSGSEAASIVGGILGLVAGGAIVRHHAHRTRNDPRLQPVVLGAL